MHPDFQSTETPSTLLVYGMVSYPATVLDTLSETGELAGAVLSNHTFHLTPATPALRMSSHGWINIPPQQAADTPSPEGMIDVVRERVFRRTSPFNKPVHGFIERYFAHIDAHLEQNIPDQDFPASREWAFSAWLPLPHAQVLMPPTYRDDDIVFFETGVTFWTGTELVFVMIDGNATPTKAKRRHLEFLSQHHPQARIVQVPQDRLNEPGNVFPADLFPDAFNRFTDGLSLPKGPYHPEVLLHDLAEQA